MVVLNIAYVDNDPFSGVNNAVIAHTLSQQKYIDVALLNVFNRTVNGINYNFRFGEYKSLSALPEPFDRPDLIVFHELYRTPFLKIYKEAVALNIPYIIFPHGGLSKVAQRKKFLKKKTANWLLFNKFFKNAEAVQCLSDREKNDIELKKPLFIGPNGVYIPDFEKIYFNEEKTVFSYIGRTEISIKGIDLLIEAVSLSKEFFIRNNCSFNLYGPDIDGSHSHIKKMISDKKLEDLIFLNDSVFKKEKETILKKSDYFVQTSRTEGLSMGILEALSYGLPCVVTEGTGMDKLVRSYKAGFGCKTTSEDISLALCSAVKNKNSIKEMSRNAEKIVSDNFSWDKVTVLNLEQYKKISQEYNTRKL